MSDLAKAMVCDVLNIIEEYGVKNRSKEELEDYLEQFAADTERIDKLELLLYEKKYTGRAVLRRSLTGRGWRLHETSMEGASDTVRKAIDMFGEDST